MKLSSMLGLCALLIGLGSAGWADDADWKSAGWQDINLMDGQGLSGKTVVKFYKSPHGDMKITIDTMNLSYEKRAHYNNLDIVYASLPLDGFLSILTNPKKGGELIDEQLVPITGALDRNGQFSCSDCASFILDGSEMRTADDWISGIVVGGMIFHNSLRINATFLANSD